MRENFRIYVHISGRNSNFRTFQDKFQDNAQACLIFDTTDLSFQGPCSQSFVSLRIE